MNKKMPLSGKLVLLLFAIFYATPFVSTTVYAFATKWGKTILPQGMTLEWVKQLFADANFYVAIGNSFLVALVSLIILLVVMLPAVYVVYHIFPKVDAVMQYFSLVSYALPGVILATGLLKSYSGSQVPMFFVLVGALFITALPLIYQGIRNSMVAIDSKVLIEASKMLGASSFTTFMKVILPNIRFGVLLSSLMIFSGYLGEFVLTNLLIGGRFQTIRIYMLRRMNENGHVASSVMVIYFIILFLVGFGMNQLSKKMKENANNTRKKGLFGKENQTIIEKNASTAKIS